MVPLPQRINRKNRKARAAELRNMEPDDFENEALQLPRKSIVADLLKHLKGTLDTPQGYFLAARNYKYGIQGSDVADAMCEFMYPAAFRDEVSQLAIHVLDNSENFHREIINKIFDGVQKLQIAKGPKFQEKAAEKLQPSDINLRQRTSATALFCSLWRYGMVDTKEKVGEFALKFIRESHTLARQVIDQYTDLPSVPRAASEYRLVDKEAYFLNSSYHPINFTMAFLIEFLRNIVEDGLGIKSLHEAVTPENETMPCALSRLPPLLISVEERASLLRHIVRVMNLKAPDDLFINMPIDHVMPVENLSMISRSIITAVDDCLQLLRVEDKVRKFIEGLSVPLLGCHNIKDNVEVCNAKNNWDVHINNCIEHFTQVLTLLGLNAMVPSFRAVFSISSKGVRRPIYDAFILCLQQREKYISIVSFEKLSLASVYTNSVASADAMCKYPLELTKPYGNLIDELLQDRNATWAKLSGNICSVIRKIYSKMCAAGPSLFDPDMLSALLQPTDKISPLDQRTSTSLLPDLLATVSNETEEYVILVLIINCFPHSTADFVAQLNKIFAEVFCEKSNTSEQCCYRYAHLYACICINEVLPIEPPATTENERRRFQPTYAHLCCQQKLCNAVMIGRATSVRDDMAFYLVRCLTHLACFGLINMVDVLHEINRNVQKLNQGDAFTSRTDRVKQIVEIIYNVFNHLSLFLYGCAPEMWRNIKGIHESIKVLVKDKAKLAFKTWYDFHLAVKYNPIAEEIARFEEREKEREVWGDKPNIERVNTDYLASVISYRNLHRDRFSHSLAYHWFKRRLLNFCKVVKTACPQPSDAVFYQFIGDFLRQIDLEGSGSPRNSSGTVEDMVEDESAKQSDADNDLPRMTRDEMVADLKKASTEYFASITSGAKPLLESFNKETLSFLNFTDCYSDAKPQDFLPEGFFERIDAELKANYDFENQFQHATCREHIYEKYLLPPSPTPHELAELFVSLDILSDDTAQILASVITYMHRSSSRNLQLGARHILATLMDTLDYSAETGNEQQALAIGLLTVELVKLGVLTYDAISNIISTYILSTDDFIKMAETTRNGYKQKIANMVKKHNQKINHLIKDLKTNENEYIREQNRRISAMNSIKKLSFEQNVGYKIPLLDNPDGRDADNWFVLGLKMLHTFMRHFIIYSIAGTVGIPLNAPAESVPVIREKMLKDLVLVSVYFQYKVVDLSGLLCSLLDDMVSHAAALMKIQGAVYPNMDFAITYNTSQTVRRLLQSYIENRIDNGILGQFCELVKLFMLKTNQSDK